MNNSQLMIFCDFDGTFIKEDSLDVLFERYLPQCEITPLESKWKNGIIGSRDCISSLFEKVHKMTKDDVYFIADQLTLTDGLSEFLRYVSSINAKFYIISDGIDVIINRVLKNNDLANYVEKTYSNKLRFDKNLARFRPHSQSEDFCDHERKCALCKQTVVSRIINNGGTSRTIYIGDGKSDVNVALECEKVFATKSLLQDSTIPETKKIPFNDFTTILKHFEGEII